MRASLGVTQAALAAKLGVSTRTIGHWEEHGVPAHRVPLVTGRYAASVVAARESIERSRFLSSPEGRAEAERIAREESEAGSVERKLYALLKEAMKAPDVDSYLHAALRGFTTEQLMAEILRRLGQ